MSDLFTLLLGLPLERIKVKSPWEAIRLSSSLTSDLSSCGWLLEGCVCISSILFCAGDDGGGYREGEGLGGGTGAEEGDDGGREDGEGCGWAGGAAAG